MPSFIALLAFFGLCETGYLIFRRLSKRQSDCQKVCSLVLESPYKKTFGVENDLLGLVFYSLIFVASLMQITHPLFKLTIFDTFYQSVITIGVGFTLYFIYLQWQKIKTWCVWCLGSASLVISMAGLLLIR